MSNEDQFQYDLNRWRERKIEEAKTKSWIVALAATIGMVILTNIVVAAVKNPEIMKVMLIVIGVGAGVFAIRYGILLFMKHRIKMEFCKRAMIE